MKNKLNVYKEWLCDKFPTCFNDSFRPLAKGIFFEISEQLPDEISKTQLRTCLHWYTRNIEYLNAFTHHHFRINLDGTDAEAISVRDREDAQINLIISYMRKAESNRKLLEKRDSARRNFLKNLNLTKKVDKKKQIQV
jgi:sRNA-binding protein